MWANAAIVLGGRAIGAAISLAYLIILPATLGVESYGYYAFWFAQLFLLFTFFEVGGSDYLRRFLPLPLMEGDGAARSIVARVLRFKIAVFPLGLAFAFGYDDLTAFLIIFFAGVLAGLSWISSDMHFAAGNTVRYSLYHLLRKVVRLVALLTFFAWWGQAGILPALLTTEAVILLVFIGLSVGLLPKSGVPSRRPIAPFRFGIVLFAANLLFFAMGRAPVLVAKPLGLSFETIALVALSIDICYFALRELFYGFSESLMRVQVIRHGQEETSQANRTVVDSVVLSVALILPAMTFLWCYAEALLGFIGDEYRQAASLVGMAVPLIFTSLMSWVYRQNLIVRDRSYQVLVANAAGLTAFGVALLWPSVINAKDLVMALVVGSAVNLVAMRFAVAGGVQFRDEFFGLAKVGVVWGSMHALVVAVTPLTLSSNVLVWAASLAFYGAFLSALGVVRWSKVAEEL